MAVDTPSLKLKGYPQTKSAPSLYGSYRVLKNNGVDGVSRFCMCCANAFIYFQLESFATFFHILFKVSMTQTR